MTMPYVDEDKRREARRKSAKKAYWANPSKARQDKRKIPKVCEVCGVEYLARSQTTRACTRSCSARLAHMEGRANRLGGPGAANPTWKGGRKTNAQGYVLVWVPPGTPGRGKNAYMMEHRLVMQEKIGRPLEAWEIVHHRNGVKDDNRPANLEIVTRARHAGVVICPHCQTPFKVN